MKRISLSQFAYVLCAATAVFILSGCNKPDGFKEADADNNGEISQNELELYLLETVFAASDANGDAKVSFEEWQAVNPGADPMKFKKPDANRDSFVDPQEARAHFVQQGTMADLFDKIDGDNSGAISKSEVRAFYDKLKDQSGSTQIEKLYNTATE